MTMPKNPPRFDGAVYVGGKHIAGYAITGTGLNEPSKANH